MINGAISTGPLPQAVADEQRDPEVARLAATIDLMSAISIQHFGQEIAERSSHYTDEVLRAARATAKSCGCTMSDTGSLHNHAESRQRGSHQSCAQVGGKDRYRDCECHSLSSAAESHS